MGGPLIPAYGESTLAELVPALGASLGVPGWRDALGLPAAQSWVILMVDGLGAMNLRESASQAPFLSSLWGEAHSRTITSAAPSTTATSLSCLGTGLTPGEHGIVGYSFRHPFTGGFLNALAWESGLSGLDVQPRLTAFERLASAGVHLTSVCPARFEGSGLTEASLRGPRFVGVPDENDVQARLGWTLDSVAAQPSIVYLYERALDHTGHGQGWRSEAWRNVLAWVDTMAADLRAALPDDVRLVITGDHGMIDVPQANRVVAEDEPGLLDGVTLVAGEGRFRQFYTERPDAVAARWAERMGESAWVRTRAQAVAEGWFGPQVSKSIAERIGDVLVVLRDDGAIMTTTQPFEFGLVGMHGSLTDDEMRVPLLVA